MRLVVQEFMSLDGVTQGPSFDIYDPDVHTFKR